MPKEGWVGIAQSIPLNMKIIRSLDVPKIGQTAAGGQLALAVRQPHI